MEKDLGSPCWNDHIFRNLDPRVNLHLPLIVGSIWNHSHWNDPGNPLPEIPFSNSISLLPAFSQLSSALGLQRRRPQHFGKRLWQNMWKQTSHVSSFFHVRAFKNSHSSILWGRTVSGVNALILPTRHWVSETAARNSKSFLGFQRGAEWSEITVARACFEKKHLQLKLWWILGDKDHTKQGNWPLLIIVPGAFCLAWARAQFNPAPRDVNEPVSNEQMVVNVTNFGGYNVAGLSSKRISAFSRQL